MKRFQWFTLAAVMLGILAGRGAQAAKPLGLVPSDSEVVIEANVRQIVDSDLFKDVYAATPQATAQLQVVKNLVGVDLLKDVGTVVFFGQMNDKQSGGLILQARYDENKLLPLVKVNPQYKTETMDGQVIHEWWDEKEKRTKFGLMLPDDLVAVYNSKASLEASLAALKDPSKSILSTGEAPSASEPAAAPLAVSLSVHNRQNQGPLEKYHIAQLMGSLKIDGGNVSGTLTVTSQKADDVAKWTDVMRGIVAAAQLQPDNADLRDLAARAKIEPGSDGKSATLTTSVPQSTLAAAIKAKAGHQK